MASRIDIPKPPAKVREGQVVSARWMNGVVDCLDALRKTCGSGSSGGFPGSSSSIDSRGLIRNTKFRWDEDEGLPVYCKEDFKLRVKPKQFCAVDKEGNWDKVLQVHEGHIIDYRDMDELVPMGGGSGSGSQEEEEKDKGKEDAGDEGGEGEDSGPQEDCGPDWFDMGIISKEPLEVYCIIKQDSTGAVTEAYFSNTEEKYKAWGFKSKEEAEKYAAAMKEAQAQGRDKPDTHGDNDLEDGSGVVSVLIGKAHFEEIGTGDDKEKHYYIEQNHAGRIELQVVEVQPFAPIATEGSMEATGGAEPLCIFLERDENLFIFKGLHNREGITLSDGDIIGIGLEYANDGLVAQSDSSPLDAGEQMLGGVNFIKYNSLNAAPHIRYGVIDIPTADTVERHATGVVSTVTVSYVEEGEDPKCYIEDGNIHIEIIKYKPTAEGSWQYGSGTEDGSAPWWPPGGSGGSSGGGGETCGCAAKWQALEAWKASIEARLAALENAAPGGGCNCECHAEALMEQIQAAIDEAVANVQVQASLSQVLEVTQTGELRIDGGVNASSGGGNSSVDAHY